MRDGKLSKVTLETRIRANVRKNGGPCSTLRYIFSSWMRENIHDVQSSCFIFLFPFFWVVCYFIWLRVQCNLFHPILFHPISLTIFSKPCICHVVTRMTMNTWVWQRIFPILYFMPWNYIIAYKMHRFGICSSRKQIPLWGMCLLKLKKNELVDWFYYRDYRGRRDYVCLANDEGRISTITLLGIEMQWEVNFNLYSDK